MLRYLSISNTGRFQIDLLLLVNILDLVKILKQASEINRKTYLGHVHTTPTWAWSSALAMSGSGSVPLLHEFGVSETRGFIFDEDPALSLPPYFSKWDEVSNQIPSLIQKGNVRDCASKLPLLDHTRLQSARDYRRAHAVLATIAQAYVWSEGDARVPQALPRNISVPWVGVSEQLGLPPVITHCDGVLNNWTKIDSTGPMEFSNLRTIYSFSPAGKDEEWFFLITAQIELEAAPAIGCVVRAQRSVLDDDVESIGECLETIAQSLKRMQTVLLRMYEQCDPSVFYNEIRPFLAGWKGMRALPEGLLYEGVWEIPMQFAGGSAAQSSTIQCFSEGLGIDYSFDSQAARKVESHANFLTEMRDYMPREHCEFLAALSTGPSIRDYVKRSNVKGLIVQYNSALTALEEFRSKHIQVVARYITVESKKCTSQDHDSLKDKGTGGTGIMSFLKFIRDKTRQHVL